MNYIQQANIPSGWPGFESKIFFQVHWCIPGKQIEWNVGKLNYKEYVEGGYFHDQPHFPSVCTIWDENTEKSGFKEAAIG